MPRRRGRGAGPRLLPAAGPACAAVALLACAPAQADAGASAPRPAQDAGMHLYEEKCAMCHRGNGMGTGLLSRRYPKGQELLENRTDLSAALVRTAVRTGLNNMPALSRAEVSDAQLAAIAGYLSKGVP